MQVPSSIIDIYVRRPTLHNLPAEFIQANESLANKWNAVPFYGDSSNGERFNEVLKLFKTPDLVKPSTLAGFKKEEVLSPTVKLINDLFIEQVESYRSTLITAINKDVEKSLTSKNLRLKSKDSRVQYQDDNLASQTGAVRLIRYTPNIFIIRTIARPVLSFVGSIYGSIKKKSIISERIDVERSLARQEWLNDVFRIEKDRIQKSKNLIEQRILTLAEEIDQAGDFVDMDLLNELKQLDKLSKFIDRANPLQIRGMSINEFIEKNSPQGS